MAATFAAAAAVGLGVVLARARERREESVRRQRRDFALLAGERLSEGLQRMMLAQVDTAIELLEGGREGAVDERAVHETRKALKRLRALLRLLRPELGDKRFARENAALRDVAARLAGARDSEVIHQTLQGLIERHPRRLGSRPGARRLLAHLEAEHRRASSQSLAGSASRTVAIAELHAFRLRAAGWRLPETDAFDLIEPGLRRIYAQGRSRYRRAAHRRGDHTRAMHEWRKRVKDLRYAAELLQRRGEAGKGRHKGSGKGSAPGRHGRGAAGRLRRIERCADDLGELLGEEHDLSVLAERIRSPEGQGRPPGSQVGRKTEKLLLKLIARRRRKLRRKALRGGERLYGRSPSKLSRRVRAAYAEGRRVS